MESVSQRCLDLLGECHGGKMNVTARINVTIFPVYESLVASLILRARWPALILASDWLPNQKQGH